MSSKHLQGEEINILNSSFSAVFPPKSPELASVGAARPQTAKRVRNKNVLGKCNFMRNYKINTQKNTDFLTKMKRMLV